MSNNNDFGNRANEPLRVFMSSENAYKHSAGRYQFYLDLDSFYDDYDIYFQVKKLQCTYSWHNIHSNNNVLSFNGGATVVVVPPGNYSIYALVDYLNSQLPSHNVTYDTNTGKITISSALSFTWDVTSSLYTILGWKGNFPVGTAGTFTSPGLPDVSPIKVVNFHLTTVPSRSFAMYPGVQYTRYMCSIFVGNHRPYDVITSDDTTQFRESTIQNRVRFVEIQLFDQTGQPVELNTGNFQIVFEFSFRSKKVVRLSDEI